MKLGILGAGKAGFALGKYFGERGIPLAGYFSRSPHSAAEAAAFTGSKQYLTLEEVVKASDTLLITTPDGENSHIWDRIKQLSIQNKILCHCSGSLSSAVFSGIEALGAFPCSMHPLLAISDKLRAHEQLAHSFFTLEGDPRAVAPLKELLIRCGNPVRVIRAQDKPSYHAAACIASNLVVALAQTAAELLSGCGFSEAEAIEALAPLLTQNVKNICSHGVAGALTGPVERGDSQTIASHLACLEGDDRELYRLLSTKLLPIARTKHPGRKDTALQKLLEGTGNEKHSCDICTGKAGTE